MGDATIRVQALDGGWETLGAGRLRGITAETIVASSNDWGPDQMSFAIKAEPGANRPDLLPYTPCELEVDGIVCWAGRVKARPAGEREHQVQCEGWQYHLDDDLLDRVYVHTRLADYVDYRSLLSADLVGATQSGTINVDDGILTLGFPNGAVLAAAVWVGVTLDLGPDSTAIRTVLSAESSFNAGNVSFYLMGHSNQNWGDGVGRLDYVSGQALNAAPWTAVSQAQTFAATIAAGRRYVTIILWSGAGLTAGADVWIKIRSLQLFRLAAYESGNASILEADEVIRDVLPAAPLLNQATTMIADGSFSIPEYHTGGYQTPRTVIEQVNAYENLQHRISGPDLKTLEYRAKPSSPLFEVGEWSGSEFSDASVSGQDIYDTAVVEATGPDGAVLIVKRTQTGTLVDRRGFHRARVLPIRTAITQAVGERFGDLWLTEHRTAPFSGDLNVAGNGVRRVQGGSSVPPHVLLLHVGEKIRLAHRVDPDTGAWGRDGRIAAVTYRHDDRACEIDIDDRRDHFEGVLARYGALVDQLR